MSRGPDAGTLLQRALARHAANQGCAVEVVATDMTRWASATFTGARHHMTVHGVQDRALDDWLARLDDADLPLRGHLVADITVRAVRREGGVAQAALEALTVEL